MANPDELDYSLLHVAMSSLENAWHVVQTRLWFDTQSLAGFIDDVRAWFAYRELRNLTSHTHDQLNA